MRITRFCAQLLPRGWALFVCPPLLCSPCIHKRGLGQRHAADPDPGAPSILAPLALPLKWMPAAALTGARRRAKRDLGLRRRNGQRRRGEAIPAGLQKAIDFAQLASHGAQLLRDVTLEVLRQSRVARHLRVDTRARDLEATCALTRH